ncbi:MAG: hypothetical protein U0790_03695 [Isosphaeraceae bacterium]
MAARWLRTRRFQEGVQTLRDLAGGRPLVRIRSEHATQEAPDR